MKRERASSILCSPMPVVRRMPLCIRAAATIITVPLRFLCRLSQFLKQPQQGQPLLFERMPAASFIAFACSEKSW